MKMKYSLLNCEGDFLFAEKIGGDWFFKLLVRMENVKGSNATYHLEKTDPIEILNFLKGKHTIYHEQYKDSVNYANYNDDYKSRSVLVNLIQVLITEIYADMQHDTEFLNGFIIPSTR